MKFDLRPFLFCHGVTGAGFITGEPEAAAIFPKSDCAAAATPLPSTMPGSDFPSDFRKVPREIDMPQINSPPPSKPIPQCSGGMAEGKMALCAGYREKGTTRIDRRYRLKVLTAAYSPLSGMLPSVPVGAIGSGLSTGSGGGGRCHRRAGPSCGAALPSRGP